MGCFLTCRVPLNKILCTGCQVEQIQHRVSKENQGFCVELNNSGGEELVSASQFAVNVDVTRIKCKREENGQYSAVAQMFVTCPKCEKLHEIEQIINAPKLFFENSKKCDICGNAMTFQEDSIEIEDMNGKPYVHMSGKLYCKTCKRESVVSAETEASEVEHALNKHSYSVYYGKGEKLIMQL